MDEKTAYHCIAMTLLADENNSDCNNNGETLVLIYGKCFMKCFSMGGGIKERPRADDPSGLFDCELLSGSAGVGFEAPWVNSTKPSVVLSDSWVQSEFLAQVYHWQV